MINKKINTAFAAIFAVVTLAAFAEEKKSLLYSTSKVDWITRKFTSNISLDVDLAGIEMPSGKNTAFSKISTRLPDLVKDPLLTLNVDSNNSIGDMILGRDITYQDVAEIISSSDYTTGYFKKDSSDFTIDHTIGLSNIHSLFVRHSVPYKLQKPIDTIPSKPFTGIIIDARGKLPVHGEFIEDTASPCFFPRVFNDEMDVIYERNMTDPVIAKKTGICRYDFSDDETRYNKIAGTNPLHIVALETFGENRSDIVIKKEDALKITCIPENLELLKNGKIVILLDKENLIYNVSAPLKDAEYYATLRKLKTYPPKNKLGPDGIEDTDNGLKFLYNLKFIPDSPELLDSEKPRITECAKMLKEALNDNYYTIFIAGHTADIGQPSNQMILSIQRTETIIKSLVREGIPKELFTYKGYGATVPAKGGDNKSEAGRAVNRRVEITLRPRQTYIQRAN